MGRATKVRGPTGRGVNMWFLNHRITLSPRMGGDFGAELRGRKNFRMTILEKNVGLHFNAENF